MTALLIERKNSRRSARGFTLIELLLVMVILAILAAVVVPRLVGRADDAKIAAAKTDISNLDTALHTFEVDNGRFPTSDEGLNALLQSPADLDNWKGPYIPKLPNDPWGDPYVYTCPGTNKDFDLVSFGPDKRQGTPDDITN